MNPSKQIDQQIASLPDWRGEMMKKLRAVINAADSNLKEDVKWGAAVFVLNGNVCALSAFKTHVKINFFKGAQVPDPNNLFNAGLDAKTSRSIDFHEGDKIEEEKLKDLIRSAVTINK
jgi:hypothetical protein